MLFLAPVQTGVCRLFFLRWWILSSIELPAVAEGAKRSMYKPVMKLSSDAVINNA